LKGRDDSSEDEPRHKAKPSRKGGKTRSRDYSDDDRARRREPDRGKKGKKVRQDSDSDERPAPKRTSAVAKGRRPAVDVGYDDYDDSQRKAVRREDEDRGKGAQRDSSGDEGATQSDWTFPLKYVPRPADIDQVIRELEDRFSVENLLQFIRNRE
jgi:hypothetical protein